MKDHVVDSDMTLVTVRTSEGSVKWAVGKGAEDKIYIFWFFLKEEALLSNHNYCQDSHKCHKSD